MIQSTHRAPKSFEHLDRNIVMRSMEIDDDRLDFAVVGRGVFLNIFLSTGMCAFFTHRM